MVEEVKAKGKSTKAKSTLEPGDGNQEPDERMKNTDESNFDDDNDITPSCDVFELCNDAFDIA